MANTTSSRTRLDVVRAVSVARLSTRFGEVRICWHRSDCGPKVVYVSLPAEVFPPHRPAWNGVLEAADGTCAEVADLANRLQCFLEGEPTTFDGSVVDFGMCSEFERRVLLADSGIPRGSVSTYGRVAGVVGSSGASRAVGQALARNPFPMIIPCHRVVRSDGRLGGYRGGLRMKRALLRMEDVEVCPAGKVAVDRFFY